MPLLSSSHFDPHANDGPLVIRLCIGMMILSFFATSFRFLARKLVKQPLLWDDWFIVLALAFSWVTVIWQIVAVKTGEYGQHAESATPTSAFNFFRALYVVQITYLIAIACVKFSIMMFYRRLFKVDSTRMPLLILGGVVAAWLVATFLVGIFSCSPVNGFWIRTKPSKCINSLKYFLGVAIPNITTDIILIIFPMPILWNLNVNRTHKIALSGIFLIGGFIVVISCLRLVTVIQASDSEDFTWSLVPLGIFNAIEINVGILCACLPSMTPLLRLAMGRKARKSTDKSDKLTPRSYWPRKRGVGGDTSLMESNASLTWLNETPDNHGGTTKIIRPNAVITGPDAHIELQPIREDNTGIHVQKDISWTRTS